MNQIIMILLISVLVLVHEFGHYVAARLCKVRVTRFGIGMPIGPSWKMFTFQKTDFYIHAFLFGGYVSFPDDESETSELSNALLSEQPQNKEKNDKIKQEEKFKPEELYETKSIGQKFFIVSAGVIMNIVFAVFLVMFCAMYYHKLPSSTQKIYVNDLSEHITSNIANYDIKKGDKIEKINGHNIDTFYKMTFLVQKSKLFDNYAQEDLMKQNLKELKKLNPNLKETIKKGTVIKLPELKPENSLEVSEDTLKGLEKYVPDGIKLNDEQIELRDEIYSKKSFKPVSDISIKDLALALSDSYKPLNLIVKRSDDEIEFKNIMINKEGAIGIYLQIEEAFVPTVTFKDVVYQSCRYLYTTTTTMLYSLWQLISGKINASDMHGVIAVVKIGGDIIASKGMLNGILLTAMISLNLAIMNFLPIPALDGGHALFLTIEKFTGKKPSREVAEKLNNFFFILLILLMVAICYNDIFALVTKKF